MHEIIDPGVKTSEKSSVMSLAIIVGYINFTYRRVSSANNVQNVQVSTLKCLYERGVKVASPGEVRQLL